MLGLHQGKGYLGNAKNADWGGGDPHFWDFVNPKETQATKTHHLLGGGDSSNKTCVAYG